MSATTIEARITRLEQRAHSDDDTMNSILHILERMDQRLATLESRVATLESNVETLVSSVATLVSSVAALESRVAALESGVATLTADMVTVKTTTADTNKRVRVRGFNQ